MGVVQAGDIGHADFVEIQVGLGLCDPVEPGLDVERIEFEELLLPVDGSVVSGIHARQIAEIGLFLGGRQILRVRGGRSRDENQAEN